MNKSKLIAGSIILATFLAIFFGAMAFVNLTNINQPINTNNGENNNQTNSNQGTELVEVDVKMIPFKSEQDFKDYLSKSPIANAAGFSNGLSYTELAPTAAIAKNQAVLTIEDSSGSADRFSQTNTQELSIDEADIVKTDGANIYFSQENYYRKMYGDVILEETTVAPSATVSNSAPKSVSSVSPINNYQSEIKIIKAFKPEDMKILSKIEGRGNMFLADKTLILLNSDKIIAYDVSNASSPKESWDLKTSDQRSYLVQSRLSNDTLYLVYEQYIDSLKPCPIYVAEKGSNKIQLSCEEIYHPISNFNTQVVYTFLAVNPKNGEVKNKTAYVGNPDNTVIYMSPENIYLTYTFYPDPVAFVYDFFVSKCKGLVPEQILEKLQKLMTYDISSESKMTEFSIIMEEYQRSLDSDQRLMLENELANRMNDYLGEHQRDLAKTGIVKIAVNDLKVKSSGTVPGSLLNQFSLDEYNENLRVATTIGSSMFTESGQSVSDVYVLDKSLNELSSVKDLGKGERIYSVRFLKDRGYVVTFKQIDPFYVLDLSNPAKAELKGELKIPGFSSYLHPLNNNLILGIGQEDGMVKVSIFDVSNPSNPIEKSKYNLKDYWTEVSSNHHAFLLDSKHSIFFLPGSQGGYVFSYSNGELTLKKAISDYQAKRAVYINDYLYLISDSKVVVLDENTWEKINELTLE